MGRATKATDNLQSFTVISIHALRGEGDQFIIRAIQSYAIFQSTPSVGRATLIHSKRAQWIRYFNPRPPWGGRLYTHIDYSIIFHISIHALRGEGDSFLLSRYPRQPQISIHALRGEGDPWKQIFLGIKVDFNPRPPWGGRQQLAPQISILLKISIHALRGEGDIKAV